MEPDINELLNSSPLMKTFTFDAWIIAGFMSITHGFTPDYYISHPQGMKGYIINLTLRGQTRAEVSDGLLLCRGSDLLLSPPGVPHHYGRDERSEYWDHLWVYFTPRPYWVDWLKWDQTTHGIGKTTISDPDQLQRLHDLFYEVIRHHSASVPLPEALTVNALERLVLRCFQQQPIGNRHTHSPRINAIYDYLNAHIAQGVEIETLAAMVFISPSRLAHLFRNGPGQAVYTWQETQRINHTRWLTQDISFPLSRIALSVGYSDPVYSTRLFRKHNDIPPGEYRKRYAEMKG